MTDEITQNVAKNEDGSTTPVSQSSKKTITFTITMHVKSDSDSLADEYESLEQESTDATSTDATNGEESAE